MGDQNDIRIFVAMPGDLGKGSRYGSPESVERNLFDPIKKHVENQTQRKVDVKIEKKKNETGPIYPSMFAECVDADVYFADLTNRNANVFLELGVRWALSDGLTIPIYQNASDLVFNVAGARAFRYDPDNISQLVIDLSGSIVKYLSEPHIDSPVRANLGVISIKKSRLESMESEIARLKEERGEDLFEAAGAAVDLNTRLVLLEKVVETNPSHQFALVSLGIQYRNLSRYDDAERVLRQARALRPGDLIAARELGITLSKWGKIDSAIVMLKDALGIAPRDPEALRALGGALRRKGVADAHNFDRHILEEARECYKRAADEDRFDLYAALNVCRLDVLLAQWMPARLNDAIAGFGQMLPLCQYEAAQNPDNAWRHADLAEALMFVGKVGEAKAALQRAVALVPEPERGDYLVSVSGPLKGYLSSSGMPGNIKDDVRELMSVLPP